MKFAGVFGGDIRQELTRAIQRHPELGVQNLIYTVKCAWSDADNSKRVSGEHNCFADDVFVRVEAALPKAGSQHHGGRVFVAADEAAPKHHRNFNHIEEVGGDALAPDALRHTTSADGSGNQLEISGNIREGFRLLPQVGVLRPGEWIAALIAGADGVNRNQRGRIAHRWRTQDETADHGEDGCVGADAEADGKHGDRGDAGMFPQCPHSVGKITQERFQSGQAAALALSLAGLLRSAEPDEGLAAGFFGTETGADAVLGVHGHMALQLGRKFTVAALAAEHSPQAKPQGSQFTHGCSL